jgi:hypothetical protein
MMQLILFILTYKKERAAGRKRRKDKLRRVISAIQPNLNQGRGDENASSVEDRYGPFCHIYGCKFAL